MPESENTIETLDIPQMGGLPTCDGEVDVELLREIPKPFAVTNRESANWLVRKIVAAREYAAHVQTWADAEKRRAQREEATLMFLFGRQIQSWANEEIEKRGGKRKSIALPAGTVGYRRLATKLCIDDTTAAALWARSSCPDALVISETLNKSALNAHFKATGELPDGSHVEPEIEKFYVG